MSTLALNALKNAVIVVPAADRAVVSVRGGDRLTWLNGLVTQDLAPLGAADPPAVYGLAVNKTGRIVADLFAVADGERILLAVPRDAREDLVLSLDHYLVMEDAEVAREDGLVVWLAHGPRAGEVIAAARASGGAAGAIDVTGL